MSNRRSHFKEVESQHIHQLAEIMAVGAGPFTRKQLAVALHKFHPDLTIQELLNIVSTALNEDKHINNRFKFIRPGWWDLAK